MGILATAINLSPDSTFFFQLAVFGLAIAILSWGVFGPVTRVLDLRKQKTLGDSTEAEDILARANALAIQYAEKIRETRNDAQTIKEELRQEGFAKATEIMNAARHDSLGELDKARKTLASQVETARKALSDEANTFALAIVQKLAPQDLQAVDQKKILEENGAHE